MFNPKYAGHPRSRLNKTEEVVVEAPALKPVEVKKPEPVLKPEPAKLEKTETKATSKAVETKSFTAKKKAKPIKSKKQ
jgi:hypothetical protein